ncbi:MAG: pyruvate, phosphate dikinase [Candidatus Woesearchaeota archaeon]
MKQKSTQEKNSQTDVVIDNNTSKDYKKKWVYSFEEGDASMRDILGGKGANLSEMTKLGIPVPSGFTVTTEACAAYYNNEKKVPQGMSEQVEEHLQNLEQNMGLKFGDANNPLFLSVRSGAAASMPGMMDTVLNLGMNDVTVEALVKKTKNERFAWDSYRRFLQMFGDVDMGVKHALFEEALHNLKQKKGVELDTELDATDLKELVSSYKSIIKQHAGREFPQDPREQLTLAINAVFGSWNNSRAHVYRKLNNLTHLKGTAVNVQSMVFGNMGDTSGTGVCFSRDPSTGENVFYGEYLMNAQGEDVVAGIRTPKSISTLETHMPEVYNELVSIYKRLEKHYKDMQDMEFTIQDKKLYMLQTRSGKRTAKAAVKIAVDMVSEGLIDEKTAVIRVDPASLDQLLHKSLDPKTRGSATVLTKGLPASPGAVVGEIVFTAEAAVLASEEGKKVILVRTETSPEDISGMHAAQGILTSRGGMTSHAAVVARGMGKCCVAGASDAIVKKKKKTLTINGSVFKEFDFISIDGSTGEVFDGKVATIDPELSKDFAQLMTWADSFRTLKIRTNADTPHDAKTALNFGAEGIGLCRTEHMFFEGDRIKAVREMILSDSEKGRERALEKLLPYQKQDFLGLFEVMKGKPVTIRLLDPPLHEFLPKDQKEIDLLAEEMGVTVESLKHKIDDLHEFNPMLGHRGCRLGISYPEITKMQARAIFEAARETGAIPEVMVPLVGNVKEFINQKELIVSVAKEVGVSQYLVGTMIEVPRAAVTADAIAKEAEFFSFGTNDLTQMGLGLSRDDAGKFLGKYVDMNIYAKDPFQSIDKEGVGELMKIAIAKAKPIRDTLKLGICGEHGGDPDSVAFCHTIGLNYVSCSPYRVPIARLAAAHAALNQ